MGRKRKAAISPKYIEKMRQHLGLSKVRFAELLELERTGLSRKSKNDGREMSADEFIQILSMLKRKLPRGDYLDLIHSIFID